jgi:hypothetical protein
VGKFPKAMDSTKNEYLIASILTATLLTYQRLHSDVLGLLKQNTI